MARSGALYLSSARKKSWIPSYNQLFLSIVHRQATMKDKDQIPSCSRHDCLNLSTCHIPLSIIEAPTFMVTILRNHYKFPENLPKNHIKSPWGSPPSSKWQCAGQHRGATTGDLLRVGRILYLVLGNATVPHIWHDWNRNKPKTCHASEVHMRKILRFKGKIWGFP